MAALAVDIVAVAGIAVVDMVAVVRSIAVVAASVVVAIVAVNMAGMGSVVVALFIPLST